MIFNIKYLFFSSVKILNEPGLRIWNLGSELYLVFSSKYHKDEYGFIFVKGWQLCSDLKTDPYYVYPRKISRETARKLLYGHLIETVSKKRLEIGSENHV